MTDSPYAPRDFLSELVYIGDWVVRFKGGRYDRLDYGQVVGVTAGRNLRLRVDSSSRSSDISLGIVVVADPRRSVLIRRGELDV
jgi:hypothetical protein